MWVLIRGLFSYDSALAAALRADGPTAGGEPSSDGDIGIGPDGKPIKRPHEDIPVVSLRDAGKFIRAQGDDFMEVVNRVN